MSDMQMGSLMDRTDRGNFDISRIKIEHRRFLGDERILDQEKNGVSEQVQDSFLLRSYH